jgi:hypothetical protein
LACAALFAAGEAEAVGVAVAGVAAGVGVGDAFDATGPAVFVGAFVAQPNMDMSNATASVNVVKVVCEILFIPSRLLNIRLLRIVYDARTFPRP